MLRLGYLHAIGGLAVGLVLLTFASGDAFYEFRLHQVGIVIDADVVNWRQLREDLMQPSYQVQYMFRLPGTNDIYTRTDSTDRANL